MDVIDNAIQLLLEEGWIRGASHTSMGYCLTGALTEGWINTGEGDHKMNVAFQAVINELGSSGLSYWNDHMARDRDHVLEVLKLANERVDLAIERGELGWQS